MSKLLTNIIYSKICGSMPRKAILLALAERANDDGSGVWVSKSRVSKEVECCRKTVRTTIEEMEADGLLTKVGKRQGPNGYTDIYHIQVRMIMALEDSWVVHKDADTLDPVLDEGEDPEIDLGKKYQRAGNSSRADGDAIPMNRPYRNIKTRADAQVRANGPAADRRKASSAGPTQADFRRMAGDAEFARDVRDADEDETPRGRLASLREELASLDRIQSKYGALNADTYTAKRDALMADIEALEKTEN